MSARQVRASPSTGTIASKTLSRHSLCMMNTVAFGASPADGKPKGLRPRFHYLMPAEM